MADPMGRGVSRGADSGGGGDRVIRDAEQDAFCAGRGLGVILTRGEPDVDAGRPGGGCQGLAHAPGTDDRQSRARGSVRVGFPFQFSHRRYQTVS